MATAVTDTFLQQIYTARTLVHASFRRAQELLVAREATLLRQLDEVQNKYEADNKGRDEELQGLEKSKQSLMENLRDNDTLNIALAAINLK
ncbi:hypothetical protein, partial [Salmonella sp. s51228]|uniref:hypothetical protein n=1 Tax=Salmonella sp. s51228 TaxID=3159652 RepID=UPI00397EED94